MVLKFVYVRVHTVGRRWSHGATRQSLRSLCRSGVENGMVFEILWHFLAGVKASLELCVRDVARYDDGAIEADACGHGVFGKFGSHGVNTFVEVNIYALGAFSLFAICLGYEL